MIAALLAVLTGTGNILLDKFLLTKQKMPVADYLPLLFSFLFLTTLVTLPWSGGINSVLAIDTQYVFYFVLMVTLAILWNMFYYEGLKRERLIEFQMTLMLTPVATVILATLFFPEEFNLPVFSAAMVGSAALFFSHLRRDHFHFDKYEIHLILAVFLMALEVMVARELLNVYSPALLYTIRTAFLAGFFALYFKPSTKQTTNQQFNLVFLTAILGAASMVARLYGFQFIGITFTTLILLLVPIFSSWYDARLNKAKIKKRTIVAFVVILLSVIYAIIEG